jgi:hypothetical protein
MNKKMVRMLSIVLAGILLFSVILIAIQVVLLK